MGYFKNNETIPIDRITEYGQCWLNKWEDVEISHEPGARERFKISFLDSDDSITTIYFPDGDREYNRSIRYLELWQGLKHELEQGVYCNPMFPNSFFADISLSEKIDEDGIYCRDKNGYVAGLKSKYSSKKYWVDVNFYTKNEDERIYYIVGISKINPPIGEF